MSESIAEQTVNGLADVEEAVPYVDPAPKVGTPASAEQEIAELKAAILAQSLVINTLAASCDWLVQNLTQVFHFVATIQSQGGIGAMMNALKGGSNDAGQ